RRRAVPPLRGAPRTTGWLSAARVLAAAHRAQRLDQAPLALGGFGQAGVAQAVKGGNTTRPRFVDHRRPVADRTFGIGPHGVDQRLVISVVRLAPACEMASLVAGLRSAPLDLRV